MGNQTTFLEGNNYPRIHKLELIDRGLTLRDTVGEVAEMMDPCLVRKKAKRETKRLSSAELAPVKRSTLPANLEDPDPQQEFGLGALLSSVAQTCILAVAFVVRRTKQGSVSIKTPNTSLPDTMSRNQAQVRVGVVLVSAILILDHGFGSIF